MKIILTFLISILISINLYSWEVDYDDNLCDETGSYNISSSSWGYYLFKYAEPGLAVNNFVYKDDVTNGTPDFIGLVKQAVNYWNEAGSEHLLSYNENGDYGNSIMVSIVDCEDCSWGGLAVRDWHLGGCIDDDEIAIFIRHQSVNYSYREEWLFNVLTHEFGHALGIDHTNEPIYMELNGIDDYQYGADRYDSKYMMMSENYLGDNTYLTEDDKFAARALYGKDDRHIKYARAYKSSSTNLYIRGTQSYGIGEGYETFAQPQIIAVKNQAYEYIMLWIRSSDRRIYYEFIKRDSNDNSKLVSYAGPYVIGNSLHTSLTSPSIAVNTSGTHGVITFRSEIENQIAELNDKVYVVGINLNTRAVSSPFTLYQSTISAPIVTWDPKLQKFVVLWTHRTPGNSLTTNTRTINYLFSDNSTPNSYTDWNSNTIRTLEYFDNEKIKTSWNPFSFLCGIEIYGSYHCALYFNRVINDKIDQDNLYTITLMSTGNDSFFSYYDEYLSYGGDIMKNYGHLNMTLRDDDTYNILMTRMPNANRSTIKLNRLRYYDRTPTIGEATFTGYSNETTKKTTTGHSLTKLSSSNGGWSPYVFMWIEE